MLAHLLKYDSTHGRYNKSVEAARGCIIVAGKEIKIYSEKKADLPWGKLDVDVVLNAQVSIHQRKRLPLIFRQALKSCISAPAGNDLSYNRLQCKPKHS